jgi:hypothetical protein
MSSCTKDLLTTWKYPFGFERKKPENRFSEGGFFKGSKPKGLALEGLLVNSNSISTSLLIPPGGDGGKVIIATVKGDIHNIGKDIAAMMLDVNGFNALDLGIDVPPERWPFIMPIRKKRSNEYFGKLST